MKMVREQMHTYTTLSDLWLHGVGSFHGPTMFICRNLGDSTSLPYLMTVESPRQLALRSSSSEFSVVVMSTPWRG